MTVQELLEQLRHYPRDVEVVLARTFGGKVDGTVYDIDKVRMKEVVVGERIATDFDFDNDADTANAVVLYPEV